MAEGLLAEASSNFSTWFQDYYEWILIASGAALFIFFLVPLVFYIYPKFQKYAIFQHWVNVPFNFNFSSPATAGLIGGRNFYIRTGHDGNIKLGVWHLLPQSAVEDIDIDPSLEPEEAEDVAESTTSDSYWENALAKFGNGIVLYFHGNTGTRALPHRIELYDLLQDMDFHVIAVDYRGFADSTFTLPDETKFVEDATAVYDWVVKRMNRALAKSAGKTKDGGSGDADVDGDQKQPLPIFVWGHSLGTGISVHTVSKICDGKKISSSAAKCVDPQDVQDDAEQVKDEDCGGGGDGDRDEGTKSNGTTDATKLVPKPEPDHVHHVRGLILESPFSNFADAVLNHHLTVLYRFLPGFHSIFVKPLKRNDVAFQSDVHIKNVNLPTLILHAVDDEIIPVFLGQKLYEAGRLNRAPESGPIYFKRFSQGFGHKFICKSPQLPKVIQKFVKTCLLHEGKPPSPIHLEEIMPLRIPEEFSNQTNNEEIILSY